MNEILDSIKEIDKIISNMSRKRCILYFQSENRDIIEKAVNGSAALQYLLNLKPEDYGKSSGNLFRTLRRTKKCLNCTQYYKLSGGVGRLEPGKNETPLFFYLSDFQTFAKAEDRAHIIKAFLDMREEWELKNYSEEQGLYLLLSSPQCLIPDGFSDSIELIREKAITEHDLFFMLSQKVHEEEKARGRRFYTDEELHRYASQLAGLTEGQIESVFERLNGQFCTALDANLANYVKAEKKKEGEKDPTIRFLEIEKEPNVAGLGNYMAWLKDREESLRHPEQAARLGTPAPKGVLLCGVPGTGKTQMAKETAWRLQVNLIQFDIGRLSSKEYGSSEAKMDHFLRRVCANAPCVMLIDEIEKTFHEDKAGEGMHEVKLQQLSQLLDWMQNRKENVLTFITANNIARLPVELLRDGRISARFFAFMPTHDDLMAILWSKLLPLAQNAVFGSTFCNIIKDAGLRLGHPETDDDISYQASPMDEVLDRIVRPIQGKSRVRTPFMTGANLESLIENTNLELLKAGKLEGCSAAVYADQFVACGQSPAFVPQGQSNMADIVDMWMWAQKSRYQEVSANTLLPFEAFQDGRFVEEELPRPGSEYDRYFQSKLKEEIEKAAERTRQQEDAWNRYQDRQSDDSSSGK